MSDRLFAVLRSVFFASLFVSLWTWFIPRWLARGELHPHWSIPAVVLMVLGGAIMVKCVWDFAWTGRGTPAPWDPPRRLVITGLYRYVRNPMYVGMGTFLLGEALLLPEITRGMLMVMAAAWLIVTAFIMLYEEPTLRRLFADDYERYCQHVRRWLPRLKPFDTQTALP